MYSSFVYLCNRKAYVLIDENVLHSRSNFENINTSSLLIRS